MARASSELHLASCPLRSNADTAMSVASTRHATRSLSRRRSRKRRKRSAAFGAPLGTVSGTDPSAGTRTPWHSASWPAFSSIGKAGTASTPTAVPPLSISTLRSVAHASDRMAMIPSAAYPLHSDLSGVRTHTSSSIATMGSSVPQPRGFLRRFPFSSSSPSPTRRRFRVSDGSSSSGSWSSSAVNCWGSSKLGSRWISPIIKAIALDRACSSGFGTPPGAGVPRSCTIISAGMVARKAIAAAFRTSSLPPARLTMAEMPAAACRPTISLTGLSIRPDNSSTARLMVSAGRLACCKNSCSLCSSETASGMDTFPASSLSSSPSSAGTTCISTSSSTLFSFLPVSCFRRRTWSACSSTLKMAGWNSKLHC
mmetsp:Transcript_34280/g.91573  ORF Transcript_34280/g.91573 Transcript_34280/m.91573 type:complete len:369 (+) Transcript_34280:3261-4367(+)